MPIRRLLLIAVSLGCAREPVQTDARDVQVKDRNVKVNLKVPNLEGGEKKSEGDTIDPHSVAVLPFQMSASDEAAAALATTLTATVTKTLSRNAELQVSSQAAVDRVSTLDPLSAGERLKMRALLRGTIKPDRDEITVSIELIEVARNNRQLWGLAIWVCGLWAVDAPREVLPGSQRTSSEYIHWVGDAVLLRQPSVDPALHWRAGRPRPGGSVPAPAGGGGRQSWGSDARTSGWGSSSTYLSRARRRALRDRAARAVR